jgi:hypothetical protein
MIKRVPNHVETNENMRKINKSFSMIKLLFKTIFGICHVKSDGKNKN